jgi:hypothetical protein
MDFSNLLFFTTPPPPSFFTHPLRLFFSSLYLATVHVLGSSFSCIDCKPYCFKEDTYGHNYNFIGYLCKLIRGRIIKARTSKKCSAFSINWENALKFFFFNLSLDYVILCHFYILKG